MSRIKGSKHTPETIEKIRKSRLGRKMKYFPRPNKRGKNHHYWKGGVTSVNENIRKSTEYKLWRQSVFQRDNYKCIWCGDTKNIEADHIKPFASYPELRFAIDNGRTLCHICHLTTDTWGYHSKSLN